MERQYGTYDQAEMAVKMKKFISELNTLDTSFIGTLTNDKCYVYTGVEWYSDERNTGRLLSSSDALTITGGGIFTLEAKKAVASTKDRDLMKKVEDIENFKALPWFVNVKDKLHTGYSTKALDIFKIMGKYDVHTQRLPIKIYFKKDGSGQVTEFTLMEYMSKWTIANNVVVELITDLEFSTANLMKSVVYHIGKDVVIIDNYGIYNGTDAPNAPLTFVGPTENVAEIITKGNVPEPLKKHLGSIRPHQIARLRTWIAPYRSCEEKHIYLNSRGYDVTSQKLKAQ